MSYSTSSTPKVPDLFITAMAPARVLRGEHALLQSTDAIAALGRRPLVVSGDRTLEVIQPYLETAVAGLDAAVATYGQDCSEAAQESLRQAVAGHNADAIIGIGGGKALDTAKLLAHNTQLPIATIPTSAATCAAWTALSNIYTDEGAFHYDVSLLRCPELLILDYGLLKTAPQRTLVAGIGDALAKWYEASVSSGHSERTLIIGAVQQARVLRDILFQKARQALDDPGSVVWQDVVDASVLMAGMIGGLGGAQCRTVAAHAVHNGLTHLPESHGILHGEKVAYGILVQLRLEEMVQGNQLAASARRQLLQFYGDVGLPKTLLELGLGNSSLSALQHGAEMACVPESDIHRLPFPVLPAELMAAMVSTAALPERASQATDHLSGASTRCE
ncbi:MAG: iron-containing alcohol dehydrogenase family protein [Elainellaceae cyanobacterium]